MPLTMYYFKPNPTIQGYTVILISEFNFGGSFPNSLIGPASLKGAIHTWTKCQKMLDKELKEKDKNQRQILSN